MYKVLIADDEEIIRRGIAHFLKKDPDIQVVAQAEDGEMALNIGGILMLKAAAEAENSSKNVSVSNIWRILAEARYT